MTITLEWMVCSSGDAGVAGNRPWVCRWETILDNLPRGCIRRCRAWSVLSEIPSRAPDELAQIKPLNAMCSLDPPLTAEVCPGMDSTLQGDDYAQALVLNR